MHVQYDNSYMLYGSIVRSYKSGAYSLAILAQLSRLQLNFYDTLYHIKKIASRKYLTA